MRALLNDLTALEMMIDQGMIESGITRIGAEQEMVLVDRNYSPACKSVEILKDITDPRFTYEIGKFNMEANLTPNEKRELFQRTRKRNQRGDADSSNSSIKTRGSDSINRNFANDSTIGFNT